MLRKQVLVGIISNNLKLQIKHNYNCLLQRAGSEVVEVAILEVASRGEREVKENTLNVDANLLLLVRLFIRYLRHPI